MELRFKTKFQRDNSGDYILTIVANDGREDTSIESQAERAEKILDDLEDILNELIEEINSKEFYRVP